MPIVFPVLRSCKIIDLSEKVIEQLRVNYFADENKIKGTLRGIKDRMER